MIDILGHIFYIFLALGMFLLARKNILGWVFRFIGELGWAYIGYTIGMSSIWFWSGIFLSMEIYGFYSWYRLTNSQTDV